MENMGKKGRRNGSVTYGKKGEKEWKGKIWEERGEGMEVENMVRKGIRNGSGTYGKKRKNGSGKYGDKG